MFSGALSGIVGWTVIYPMDVIKNRMQAERIGVGIEGSKYKSIHQTAYPDRIILNYNYFKKNLINYDFKLLKENYNNCAVKFSQIMCKKFKDTE